LAQHLLWYLLWRLLARRLPGNTGKGMWCCALARLPHASERHALMCVAYSCTVWRAHRWACLFSLFDAVPSPSSLPFPTFTSSVGVVGFDSAFDSLDSILPLWRASHQRGELVVFTGVGVGHDRVSLQLYCGTHARATFLACILFVTQ